MFDIGASELLLVVIVAILVIGPKDLPMALRTAGRWMGKVRRVSNHFRSGLDSMIREAEMEEMEKKWRDQNAAIMKAHPEASAEAMANPDASPSAADMGPQMEPLAAPPDIDRSATDAAADAAADAARERARPAPRDAPPPPQPD